MPHSVAIIPARGGSKRLPRKNVLPVLGRPLVAWTIDAARRSNLFREVWVSTDDDEIAQIAAAAGADVHRRPVDLGSDTATMVEVCLDLLNRLKSEGREPIDFCCLLATAALRRAEDIAGAYRLLSPGRTDFVMAITDYSANPLQALRLADDGTIGLMFPDLADLRPWERPKIKVDAGCTYWCTTAAFRLAQTFYGPGLKGFLMNRLDAVDVDDTDDFRLLETLMKARHG